MIQDRLINIKKQFDLDGVRLSIKGPLTIEIKFKGNDDWYLSREISLKYSKLITLIEEEEILLRLIIIDDGSHDN